MGALMPQPFKHPKTGSYYFRKVVPAHFRKALGRTEFRENLGTKDLREAKRRYPEVAARVDALMSQADGEPAHLTQKQTVALAGKWYASELSAHEDEPGDEEGWNAALGLLSDANDEGRTAKAVEADVASCPSSGFLRQLRL